jgi:hypothetical protein
VLTVSKFPLGDTRGLLDVARGLPGPIMLGIEMPRGARFLHLGAVPGFLGGYGTEPCLWAFVDTDAPKVLRKFWLLGTGGPGEQLAFMEYVGTFFLAPLVFHLFAEREAE